MQNLKDLTRSGFGDKAIDLPDVNVQSAHVIVHFLHTGVYQTLVDDEDDDTTFNASKEFHKAASVYVAARKYGLSQLRELAKTELERWGADIEIIEIVRKISKELFAALQADSPWFQDFLLEKAGEAFRADDAIFLTTDFFKNIACSSLARILAQHAVALYHERVLGLRKEAIACDDLVSRQNGTRTTEELFHVEQPDSCKESTAKNQASTHVAEGLVHDAASDVALQSGGGPSVDVQPEPEPEHDLSSVPPPEPLDEVPLVDPFAGLNKAQRKKKLKAEAAAKERDESECRQREVEEEQLRSLAKDPEDVVPSVAVQEPEVGSFPVNEIHPDLGPELGPVPSIFENDEKVPSFSSGEQLENLWAGLSRGGGGKKKKKKNVSIVLEVPPSPPPPPPPLECEPEPQVEVAPLPTEPEPAEEVDPWESGWGSLSSKKERTKKKAKGESMYAEPAPEPPGLGTDAVPGSDLIEPDGPKDEKVIAPIVEGRLAEYGDDCPLRREHLSEGDRWKSCNLCETYLRQVALKSQV